MPRIKLEELKEYPFSVDLDVRISDLNYGGHLGHIHLLFLAHEARIRFLNSFGFTEFNCGGVSLIQADTAVMYKGEAFLGDLLTIEVGAGEPAKKGFRLFFRITRKEDGKLIALIENGLVSFDYDTRKSVPLPEEVLKICTADRS